jgi:hypothetical protein
MSPAENFIYNFEGEQRNIMLFFNNLLSIELGLTDKIRFKIPLYYRKSWICYLNPIKNNAVEIAFIRGNELSNSQQILKSKGRKQVMGVEITKLTELPVIEITEIIHEAILLDETVPYTLKKSKKNGNTF